MDKLNVGDFVFHEMDAETEKMKLLVVEDLGDDWYCCRYIHYKELGTNPHRRFHVSELTKV